MFGVSEEHILENNAECRKFLVDTDTEAYRITYNQTDPAFIRDGVDGLTIVQEAEDQYLVEYWGYLSGYFRVTREGIAELGATFLTDDSPVPHWLLDTPSDSETLPWWVPDEYESDPRFVCDRCDTETPARNIVTPGTIEGGPREQFCRDCWSEIQDHWQPGHENDQRSPLDRADFLYYEAAKSPATIHLDEFHDLLQTDDSTVLWHALLALHQVSESRPHEVLNFLPTLQPMLRNKNDDVRSATLRCLAALADEYPEQVTPMADAVVDSLDVTADETAFEAAISFVAAVADTDPSAVVNAVPKLAASLQAGQPVEKQVVLALTRIAKAYPEAVLPVTRALLGYVETEDGSNRLDALAALGHVSKEYPNVTESAIPTLVDLLDDDSFYLRANAAGLLAELADEYPSQLHDAVPRVIELLDDEDEKVRYNATSILARVAKADPDVVEPAIGALVGALDEEFPYSRENACWALGYLEAVAAREQLETLVESDSDEHVRNAAEWALQQLK